MTVDPAGRLDGWEEPTLTSLGWGTRSVIERKVKQASPLRFAAVEMTRNPGHVRDDRPVPKPSLRQFNSEDPTGRLDGWYQPTRTSFGMGAPGFSPYRTKGGADIRSTLGYVQDHMQTVAFGIGSGWWRGACADDVRMPWNAASYKAEQRQR